MEAMLCFRTCYTFHNIHNYEDLTQTVLFVILIENKETSFQGRLIILNIYHSNVMNFNILISIVVIYGITFYV